MSDTPQKLGMAVAGDRDPTWKTPEWLYRELDLEFHFQFDPCPPNPSFDGLSGLDGYSAFQATHDPWPCPTIAYMNPPYGRRISLWIRRAIEESHKGSTIVCLLPSYTGSPWWHDLVIPNAKEIRFLRGKLRFAGAQHNAPFWSAIAIFQTTLSPNGTQP